MKKSKDSYLIDRLMNNINGLTTWVVSLQEEVDKLKSNCDQLSVPFDCDCCKDGGPDQWSCGLCDFLTGE